jgi:hypothetical protein
MSTLVIRVVIKLKSKHEQVHKSSSNQAVLGELGRFQLFIDIIINLFKYYKRINDMEQDSLLNQALNECKTLHQSGKISKCGSSSILRQVLYSRSSLLSFLYLPLSISRVCALILSLVRLFLLFSYSK